jgi:malonate transporter
VNGVVGGFAALTAVIAVGWLVARTGTVGEDAAAVLSRLSYVVATPAMSRGEPVAMIGH